MPGRIQPKTMTTRPGSRVSPVTGEKHNAAGAAILKSFELFPKLPSELRNMIWRAALRPSPAMHYFHVKEYLLGETPTGPHSVMYYSMLPPQVRKSSYYWDAGLWLACQESRAVISSYLNYRTSFTLAAQASREINPNNGPYSRTSRLFWERVDIHKELATLCFTPSGFPLATHPRRDLYVFHLEFWTQILHSTRGKLFSLTAIILNPSPPKWRRWLPPVTNIGFEFHPWLLGPYYRRYDSTTPFGNHAVHIMTLYMLWLCAFTHLKVRIWLVDYGFQQFPTCETREWAEKKLQTFYNGDEKYVEVNVEQNMIVLEQKRVGMRMMKKYDHNAPGMVGFLRDLIHEWAMIAPAIQRQEFVLENHLGVLAPRKNLPYLSDHDGRFDTKGFAKNGKSEMRDA